MTRKKLRQKEVCINDNMNARRKNREQTDLIKVDHEIKHKNNEIL